MLTGQTLINELEFLIENPSMAGKYDIRNIASSALEEIHNLRQKYNMVTDPAFNDLVEYVRSYNKSFDAYLKNLKDETQEVLATAGSAYHLSV